jgi:HD-GYP domain-containing protein (c-di-GMP phosphodiesterase class II)
VTAGGGRTPAELMASARDAFHRGAWDEAIASYETALTLVPEGGNPAMRAEILRRLGTVHRDRGELDRALERYTASLAVAERAALPGLRAQALNVIGCIEMRRGRCHLATGTFRRAREVAEGIGDDHLLAMIEQNAAIVAQIEGDVAAALRGYRAALERYRRLGDEASACGALTNMGMAHVDLEEWDAAEACYREAAEIAGRVGQATVTGTLELNRAELYLRTRRYAEARESCERSLALYQRLRAKQGIAEAYRYYGMLFRDTGEPEQADAHFALSLGLAETAQDPLLQAETQVEWAILHMQQERPEDGLLRLNRALSIFREIQARREAGDVKRRLERLQEVYLSAVQRWTAGRSRAARALETGSAQRGAEYAARLAAAVGVEGWDLTWLRIGALLRDVGHLALPAEVLGKAEAFTPEERELVRVHATLGEAMVAQLDFPEEIRPVVRWHHEQWEGTGYPDELRGEEIPLAARIVAVADAYDALTTPRRFRPAHAPDAALRAMERDGRGRFDPVLFEVFRRMVDEGEMEGVAASGADAGVEAPPPGAPTGAEAR